MKPYAYIGKFGREQALNNLLPNVEYFVLYTQESRHFWAQWFPSTHYQFITACQLKTHMRDILLNNGKYKEIHFIIDLGSHKITSRIMCFLSEKCIVISSRLKQEQELRFRVVDDEMHFGFRVPVACTLQPPNYNQALGVRAIYPPGYVSPNYHSKALFYHGHGIQEQQPPNYCGF